MKRYVKLYEHLDVNESLNTKVRAKIVVHLKSAGILHGEDYEMAGSEFLANDMETAQDIADAVAGTFRCTISDDRITKDGKVPVMIVESVNEVSTSLTPGTKAGWVYNLDNSKYELTKSIKVRLSGGYVGVELPKGTIISNLPGGVFAHHKDLEKRFKTNRDVNWNDKYGVLVISSGETLTDIENGSKVLESVSDYENLTKEDIEPAIAYNTKNKGYYLVAIDSKDDSIEAIDYSSGRGGMTEKEACSLDKKTIEKKFKIFTDDLFEREYDIDESFGYELKLMGKGEDMFKFCSVKEHADDVQIFEGETAQGKKPVNIMVGRFQPFHNGHYLACKELHEKNGNPVVLVSVRGSGKSGKGTAFTEATMKKMMKDVISKSGFIIDHVEIKFVAFDTQLFPALRPKYEPVLFGAGEDRIETYQRQTQSMRVKHKNKLNIREDFAIHLTGRYGSGTAVRQAITDRDEREFKQTMPNFLHGYWDILSKEMGMNESKDADDIIDDVENTTEPTQNGPQADDNETIDRIGRTIDAVKLELAKTGSSIEKLKVAIERGAKEPKIMESYAKLMKIRTNLLKELIILESKQD